jgi:hypothetical protein
MKRGMTTAHADISFWSWAAWPTANFDLDRDMAAMHENTTLG